MQLTFGHEIEGFRTELVAFLDEHLPPEASTVERISSSAYLPDWARQWQRTMFDHGWLQPGNAPEFGGRNAGIVEQYVYFQELGATTRRCDCSDLRR
ncbi:acyl-CoA dehydrogenase [Mycolicibacterium farcinogenes]|uniref:Acyl-CoA dehydrogenase n=1 Tax=Mycolicibacterium senegalense TaxID=1796 RepID=A0A378T3L1_9MYCO|nr:alkylation response protein AidB-like acyl-CoA dehydrogenase [Mycolicibacterium senegalense]CDP83915.1 acyl-CoA dehydrogenase [Mycolicibacterium farcinogenes]STZ55408.1 acyl-CoA dehydrogenase [Mycolicibacterium senegalense]